MFDRQRTNLWIAAGILAPLLYGLAVILGGWLTPGYSHLDDPVSALIQSDAPAKALIDLLFAAYNLLLIMFAFRLAAALALAGAAISPVTPAALGLAGVLGLVMWPFPMDAIGAGLTATGTIHIIIAGFQSLSTIVAILSLAVALRRQPGWQKFSAYCMASLAVLVVTGGLAARSAATVGPMMGLWERLTIGTFDQWVLVLAVTLLARQPARE